MNCGRAIYKVTDKHFDEVQHAGIALNPKAEHIGVLFRDEEANGAEFLHLAWHQDFIRETPKNYYVWIQPKIHIGRLRQVKASCRRIWTANQDGKIPYGLSDPRSSFDGNGRLVLGDEQSGLTCATFVLAVYDRAGVPLLEYGTWFSRPEDVEWQEWVIRKLEEDGVEKTHVDKVRNETGLVRFRPIEVAGAALAERIPSSFNDAIEKGEEVLDFLGFSSS